MQVDPKYRTNAADGALVLAFEASVMSIAPPQKKENKTVLE